MALPLRATETAKLIRAELKNRWPATRFSVRKGAGSIHVSWHDGPQEAEVMRITDLFEGTDSVRYVLTSRHETLGVTA